MALAMSNEYDAAMLMKKFSSSVAKSTGETVFRCGPILICRSRLRRPYSSLSGEACG